MTHLPGPENRGGTLADVWGLQPALCCPENTFVQKQLVQTVPFLRLVGERDPNTQHKVGTEIMKDTTLSSPGSGGRSPPSVQHQWAGAAGRFHRHESGLAWLRIIIHETPLFQGRITASPRRHALPCPRETYSAHSIFLHTWRRPLS